MQHEHGKKPTSEGPPVGDEDGWRLTEDGIHQWFQEVRLSASVKEATLIDDITFHGRTFLSKWYAADRPICTPASTADSCQE